MTSFSGFYTLKQSAYKKSVNGFIPGTVVVPLMQDGKYECDCLVKVGDKVLEGQLIAEKRTDSLYSDSYIYSPVPGVVEDIILSKCPNGSFSKAVKIKVGGSFSFLGKKTQINDWNLLSSSTLLRQLSEKGIINTFIASSPVLLSEQVKNISEKKKKLIVVRFFDEDTTRLCDSLISSLFINELISGINILVKTVNADGLIFITDKNFVFPEELKFLVPYVDVKVNSKLYSLGFVPEICKTVKKVVKDELFLSLSKDDLFIDSSTVLEVYRTIINKMPVMDRYVHVSGECLQASGLIKVKIGTNLQFLADQCGGFIKEPGVVIINGLVTGSSVNSLDVPVTKYVKSVVFLPNKRKPSQKTFECVMCGNCRRACPSKLSPDIIYRYIAGGKLLDKCYIESSVLCFNCGLCNSVCPSRLPLSHSIYELAKKLKENKNG